MSFWSDFFGVGSSAEERANRNIATQLQEQALQQQQQALLMEQNIQAEELLGREAAARHSEVANINAGNMAAREAEMAAVAQQNAAQRAIGARGGSGAGALAGMRAGQQAREAAMPQAFARQQGRQDTARGQLEQSQRQTRQAINQQQQQAMRARESANLSNIQAEQQLAQNMTAGQRAGGIFNRVFDLGMKGLAAGTMLSDERYKDFHGRDATYRVRDGYELPQSVMDILGVKK